MTKKAPSKTAIAIIAAGGFFPKAPGLREYWHLLYHGVDAISEIPASHWSPQDYYHPDPKKADHVYCKRGGFLEPVPFDPTEFGIPPSALPATDTSQLLGLLAAKRLLEAAGYGEEREFDRDRTSVILGVTGTQELVIPLSSRLGYPAWRKALEAAGLSPETRQDVLDRLSDAYVPWQENSFPGLLGNVVAGRICNRLNLGGTNCVVDAACASSMSAIHLAILELEARRCDMAITGGVDTLNDIFMHMCFARTHTLSKTGDARPFSATADGTVLGEGVGLVLLKRLPDAEADGDDILAVIRGVGSSSDGKSQSIYSPRPEGQAKALRKAYRDAGFEPDTVGLLEAHGTGTRVGDKMEFTALCDVFGEAGTRSAPCALGSAKSNIGHTKAAAGAAGLIKAALALHHKVFPKTLKADPPDPDLGIAESPFCLNTETRPWFSAQAHPRRAGVSAFGFGGSNFHLVLEEYRQEKTAVAWDGSVEIFAFSAPTADALRRRVRETVAAVQPPPALTEIARLADAARRSFSRQDAHRLVLTVKRPSSATAAQAGTAFATALKNAEKLLAKNGCDHPWRHGNVFYGNGDPADKAAFLFPGQGSQYVGMGRDLACFFPEALAAFENAGQLWGASPGLTELVFPCPARDEREKSTQEAALRKTDRAQPAIGAASLAMLAVLERFGVRPAAACGHSYGELTALYAAGRLSAEDFLNLSIARGRAMAAAGRRDGDASPGPNGTMLAVKAPLDDITELLKELDPSLVLANRNSPEQGVISGPVAAIDAAERACENRGIKTRRLPVAAAFHSELVQTARAPFAEALAGVDFNEAAIPVYANSSGAPYPSDAAAARKLLADQLVTAVDFVGDIEALYRDGFRTFVEVGPKSVLTGLVRSILQQRPFHAVAVDASAGREFGVGDLAKTLCQLAALGIPVDLPAWEQVPPAPRKAVMAIPISGANLKPTPKPAAAGFPKSAGSRAAAPPKTVSSREPARKAAAQPLTKTKPALPAAPEPSPQPAPRTAGNGNSAPLTSKEHLAMETNNSPSRGGFAADAFQVVREGLKSMETLQRQTAETHQKFLETQTEASRSLQRMLDSIQRLTQTTLDPAQGRQFRRNAEEVLPPAAAPRPTAVAAATPAPIPAATAAARSETPQPASSAPPPAAPVPAPSPQAQRAVAAQTPSGELQAHLLAVVSELTGYPEEMLDLQMDIEADLGIDSIKRVEILSALEERLPELPPVSPEIMGTLRTLGQIVEHISPAADAAPAATAAPAAASAPVAAAPGLQAHLLAVVSELTGYPEEMLDLQMDIEADLGIDSIKRVEILSALEERLPELPPVSPEIMGTLRTLGQIVEHISPAADAAPAATAAPAAAPAPVAAAPGLQAHLLAVVSELTGYPEEMLDLQMDIEADLGIDSIKRVEILSALEERLPELPPVSPEIMGTLRTLGQIVEHISPAADAAPAATAAPATAAPAPVAAAPGLQAHLLAVVSELTGYPEEMLDLQMDIEADLGIDSIKRVEILSALEERLPELPPVSPEIMGTLRTLGQIVEHLAGSPTAAPLKSQAAELPEQPTTSSSVTRQVVLAAPSPEAPEAECPLLSLPPGLPVLITDNGTPLSASIAAELAAREIETVHLPPSALLADERIKTAAGLVLLPSPAKADRYAGEDLKTAFRLVQQAEPGLSAAAAQGGALLASVTRLDGAFGFRGGRIDEPFQGGLAGLVKTAAIEWEAVTCHALDIDPDWQDWEPVSEAVVLELLKPSTPGAVETGLTQEGRLHLSLKPATAAETALAISPGDVVVVSGGARGVTAECTLALAREAQPTLVLLGRSPLPEAEPAWLRGLTDEKAVKKAIIANELQGRKVSPVAVERAFQKYRAAREISHNIEAMRAAGSQVHYHPVDVTDAESVKDLMARVREAHGPIRAIVHGAGVLEDRLIGDKTPEQFDRVFDTKVLGLSSLLAGVPTDELRCLVVFSSVAGRMGNRGQVDYAMANEVLNKLARQVAQRSPDCRVAAINWGPWDGGMVTAGLKREFQRQGIGMIPAREGAACMVREMKSDADAPVEVVIGSSLQPLPEQAPEQPAAATAAVSATPPLYLTQKHEVDVRTYPVLASHQLDGLPVVPFALMAEWFGDSALHANPGLVFAGLDDIRLLKGIRLENGTKTIRLMAGKPRKKGGVFEVDMEIRNGFKGGREMIHSRARAILNDTIVSPPTEAAVALAGSRPYPRSIDEIYDDILFHGRSLRGIKEIVGISSAGIAARLAAAPEPAQWIAQPLRRQWVADPLVLDAAFQLAIVWCHEEKQAVCLPSYCARYRQYCRKFPAEGVMAVLQVTDVTPRKMRCDVSFLDDRNAVLAEMSGYEAIIDADLIRSFKPCKRALCA